MSVVETFVEYEGRKYPVSFASDDSIEIVRQRIAAVVGRYQDRLFLQVDLTLPKDYYSDPRRWEALFFRIAHQSNASATSGPLMRIYTSGKVDIGILRDDWDGRAMEEWRVRSSSFTERFILGVEETQSLVLPVPPEAIDVPAARIPLPQQSRIFSSIHPHPVVRLIATEIKDTDERTIKSIYAPALRNGTPERLPDEAVQSNQRQFENWKKLQDLPTPEPSIIHISRARWNIPWVHTEWPDALRARFEEIMYGMTVSKEVPYIGLFQNREYGMQHKFWAEAKAPKLDLAVWSSWIQTTRPQRSRPTLLLYRGSDRSNFDRLAITSAGIAVSVHRSGNSKTSLETIKKGLLEWITDLDALMPFVDARDLDVWDLRDTAVDLTFEGAPDEYDLRRLPCVANLFVQSHPTYRLLRADKADRTLTDSEIAILQVLRTDIATTPEQLALAMHIDVDLASRSLDDIRERIQEDPSILTQELDLLPKIEFSSKRVHIQHAIDMDRTIKYASILQYILTGTDAKLSEVCPARMESLAPVTSVAPTIPTREEPIAEAVEGDMFDFLEQMGSAREAPDPLFKYYTTRLRKVDADTFDTPYTKKCEPSRQVLMMTADEQTKWKGTPYSLDGYADNEKLTIPAGTTICPDFWCMKDEIPLRREQLVDNKCPVCGGKVREPKSTETVTAAPVVARDTEYKYPRFLKDIVSTKNGQGMPCCYKQPKEAKVLTAPPEGPADPFYIMGELKKLPEFRLSYIPADLARRLRLNIGNYEGIRKDTKRLKDRAQGVFRVGLGRPSKTLATMLGVPIPSPRDSIAKLFQCQFVRTWRTPGEDDGTIDNALVPYIPDTESRNQMARTLAGVMAAWDNGSLTQIQELEYIALVTGTPMYRINMTTSTVSCGLWTQYFPTGQRAVALLETEDAIDVLAYASHQATLRWAVNLYKPPFSDNTMKILRQADGRACTLPFPSYNDALAAAVKIGVVENTPIVIDPTGYAQAIWAPQRYIIPMRPDMVLQGKMRRVDYADMTDDQLPTYESERSALDIAATVNPQFAWKRDIYDTDGRRVEIETLSGLRVPVVPEKMEVAEEPAEILQTIRKGRERELVHGGPGADAAVAADISYAAEVLDFLLFILSKDLQTEEHADLRKALMGTNRDETRRLLQVWYKSVSMDVDSPTAFIKKVRAPCGQFLAQTKCTGVCGWKNGKCKVKVDQKSNIFKRLVDTLLLNPKQRSVVLDGRVSPFFSTILYTELPNERFLSDANIKWEKTQTTE